MEDTPKTIGKYEVTGELGAGGMGVVYRGWDPVISRAVAIKGLNTEAVPESEREGVIARFRHEAQAAGRLVHPRIVQIYDFIEDGVAAYIIMELVHGKTLAQHLEHKDTFSLREICQIIVQMLDGIGYAHSEGVVHRDMKSANVMINNDGRIKISDFGIAHVDSSWELGEKELAGTPSFMSPEQLRGEGVDRTTDLYSIGVIAYELLTGCRPFVGNLSEILRQVMTLMPPRPSELNSSLSPEVDEVLFKALAKDRRDRYQTAAEFSVAFRQAMNAILGETTTTISLTPPTQDSDRLLNAARMLKKVAQTAPASVSLRDLKEMNEDSAIFIDPGIKKARLLIVDDEERILTALKSLFRQRYHVFTTTDGNKALDFITRYHMHVIISDQRMPIMLGTELLRRAREISPRSVRILLTGYSDLAAIVGSINEGEIYRFISKPWDNQALQAIVAEASTIGLELANTRTPVVSLPDRMNAGVLVIDEEEEMCRVVRGLLGDLCPVTYAFDADVALEKLREQEIAVVLADVKSSQDKLAALLKLLKLHHPHILSIIATQAKDADLVIDLINQAQVFRILHKPVNVSMLKLHLHTALQRYLAYCEAPALTRALNIQSPEKVRGSDFAISILRGLELMRG